MFMWTYNEFLSSYKEDSEGATDSDDVIDYEETEEDATLVSVPLEDVETIERIMRHRNGRKGGKLGLFIHTFGMSAHVSIRWVRGVRLE